MDFPAESLYKRYVTEVHSLAGQSPGYFQGMRVYKADEAFSGPVFSFYSLCGNTINGREIPNLIRAAYELRKGDNFLMQRKQVYQLGKSL